MTFGRLETSWHFDYSILENGIKAASEACRRMEMKMGIRRKTMNRDRATCTVCGEKGDHLQVITKEIKPMRTSKGEVYQCWERTSELMMVCKNHAQSNLYLDITDDEMIANCEAAKVSQEAFDANWAEIEARLNTLPNKYRVGA